MQSKASKDKSCLIVKNMCHRQIPILVVPGRQTRRAADMQCLRSPIPGEGDRIGGKLERGGECRVDWHVDR